MTSGDELDQLSAFVSSLNFSERKALVTLARSQTIANPTQSPILYDKTRAILDKLVAYPPFTNTQHDVLLPGAAILLRLLSSPWTTGILIVFALGVSLSPSEIDLGKTTAFNKELCATQTIRRPSSWNWDAIFSPDRHRGEVIHPLFPSLSPLQRRFSDGLPRLQSSYRNKIIRPHYTSRGVSSETSTILLNRISKTRRTLKDARNYHRALDKRNVTSRDVVHEYIRSGSWTPGRTEMKQRWYPSGLLPRTYFAWSGRDIAVAAYLREFFNDLADSFDPTHRHNRVQPDWLRSDDPHHQGFVFYDLTSFTSWFHEHEPFLRAAARRFRNTPVFLVGFELELSYHDLGSLIDGYTDTVNSFSEFYTSGCSVSDLSESEFRHLCAGFLGVPGNLASCTVAHVLSLASLFSNPRELQGPGDDVGASYKSPDNMRDILTCALTLGSLQFDKVFHTPQTCLYLKRLVVDLGNQVAAAPMLVYPLLPYLINPSDIGGKTERSPYRLPDADRLLPRAAAVIVAFLRDLWRYTRGELDDSTAALIRLFMDRIHQQVGLPRGAIFQGRVYGMEEEEDRHFTGISVKFSVEDDDYVYRNPDLYFANKYVTQMVIRDTSEVELTPAFERLEEGESIVVRNSKGWRFLEDMGYVRLARGVPGRKIHLVGAAARDAFLFASEPPLKRVEVLMPLETRHLVAAGVVRDVASFSYEGRSEVYEYQPLDPNLQSWRYRRYVDLDDPKSAGFYGRSRTWVNDGLSNSRMSLSPEPELDSLDY